jgi:hypothetical protein
MTSIAAPTPIPDVATLEQSTRVATRKAFTALLLRDAIPAATNVEAVEGVVRVWVQKLRGVLPAIVEAAEKQGFGVTDLSSTEPTLETVFINLTGKDLRE